MILTTVGRFSTPNCLILVTTVFDYLGVLNILTIHNQHVTLLHEDGDNGDRNLDEETETAALRLMSPVRPL